MADSSAQAVAVPERTFRRPLPLLFFRKFLKHGLKIGCVSPSGKAMSRACCSKIDSTRPQQILELGAGTGAVTAEALQAMHPQSRLLSVEMDAEFAGILRQKFPQVLVVEGDAAHAQRHLRHHRFTGLDLILSGLPLPSLPPAVARAILECFRDWAAPSAYFSQLAAIPWIYLPYYRRLFHEVRFHFVPHNFPQPAGVYHCRHLRTDFATHLADK